MVIDFESESGCWLKMNNIFKYLCLFIASNLLLIDCAEAVTLAHVVNVGFVEAGFFLFVCGILLLFIPKFTKLGIIITLIGDAIVVSRFLFQPEILKYCEEHGFESYVAELSNDDLRLYIGLVSIIFIFTLAVLNFLRKYLWFRFWRLLGFYRTEEEEKASEERKQKKAELKRMNRESEILKKTIGISDVKEGATEEIVARTVDDVFSYDRDIALDLEKASSVVQKVDEQRKI